MQAQPSLASRSAVSLVLIGYGNIGAQLSVVAEAFGRFNDDGDERVPMDISVGDRVIYSKYGGTEVKYDGQEVLILGARDVLAIIER